MLGQDDQWQRLQTYQARQVPPSAKEAAVLLLLKPAATGPQLLFTRRALHLSSHPGEVSFPGGLREHQDFDLYATALRETQEEVGLTIQPQFVAALDSLYAKSGIRVSPFVAVVPQSPQLIANPEEVAELRWFDLPRLTQSPPEYQWFQRHGQRWRVPFFRQDDWQIWGMTGMILVNLANVMLGQQWPDFYSEWVQHPMDDPD